MSRHWSTCWETTKRYRLTTEYFFMKRGGLRQASAGSRQRCSTSSDCFHTAASNGKCSSEQLRLKEPDFGSRLFYMRETRTHQQKRSTRSIVSSPAFSSPVRAGSTGLDVNNR